VPRSKPANRIISSGSLRRSSLESRRKQALKFLIEEKSCAFGFVFDRGLLGTNARECGVIGAKRQCTGSGMNLNSVLTGYLHIPDGLTIDETP
jgi:hypothetical protein